MFDVAHELLDDYSDFSRLYHGESRGDRRIRVGTDDGKQILLSIGEAWSLMHY